MVVGVNGMLEVLGVVLSVSSSYFLVVRFVVKVLVICGMIVM